MNAKIPFTIEITRLAGQILLRNFPLVLMRCFAGRALSGADGGG